MGSTLINHSTNQNQTASVAEAMQQLQKLQQLIERTNHQLHAPYFTLALVELNELLCYCTMHLDLSLNWQKLAQLKLIVATTNESLSATLVHYYPLSVVAEFNSIRSALAVWLSNNPQQAEFTTQVASCLDQLQTNILKLPTHPLNKAKQAHFQPTSTQVKQPTATPATTNTCTLL